MTDKQALRKVFHVPLNKGYTDNEDGTITVVGKFTSDQRDEVGDIITRGATERAIPKYRQWRNIRYMHMPRPVGKVLRIGEEDGLAWNEVELKVVDEQTIREVQFELLPALSIGAMIKFDDIDFMEDGGWLINDYDLVEISLVDHPANYDATLDLAALPTDFRDAARNEGFAMAAKAYGIPFEKLDSEEDKEMTKEALPEVPEEVVSEAEEVVVEATEKDLAEDELPVVEETVVVEPAVEEPVPAEKSVDEVDDADEVEDDEEVIEEIVDEVEVEVDEIPEEVIEEVEEAEEVELSRAEIIDMFSKVIATVEELAETVKVQAEAPVIEEQTEDEPVAEEAEPVVKDLLGEIEAMKAQMEALEAQLEELQKPAERKAAVLPLETAEEVEETSDEEVEKDLEPEEPKPDVPSDLKEALRRKFAN